jgi:hemoglobin/transferrin/lactoferrin receptor protein
VRQIALGTASSLFAGRFEESDRAAVPDASFRSAGVFIENDIHLSDRVAVAIGARGQDVRARTNGAPAWSSAAVSDDARALAASANVLVRARRDLNLVATVGRGFRAPNLVERFFDGPTPDGIGYQRRNPSLRPETSLGVDLGARFRRSGLAVEAFVFRNELHDGIRMAATGDSVDALPAFHNVNVDRLRFSGTEIDVAAPLAAGFEARASYTHLVWRDVRTHASTIGTTYSTKTVGGITYRAPTGRVWANYTVRHNGRQVQEQIGRSPVGPVLPSFTVHTLRGGIQLLDRGGMRNRLDLAIENMGNRLYTEAANAGFFRPQPGRNLVASWLIDF